MGINVEVIPKKNEDPTRMIKRFIKKCKKEKIIDTYRTKTDYYIKPSVKRKLKRKKAIRERQKLQRKQERKLFR